ncbi:MAG: isoprenylcysteine carboxylmethyltransferase family protein [Anaerolineales bacterium]|nr:isoprenylcysteine carboxylmethyltransferase family protein [Anaerolineales bacterium]
MNIFLILLSLALWGVVHSILASHFAKDMVQGFLGKGGMRLYRFGYNVFSVISFALILYLLVILEDQALYKVSAPWNFIMLGGQAVSVMLLLVAVLQTDTLSFIGLRQLFEDEKPGQLVTRGMYMLVRHPLYLFSLSFLWLGPTMSVNSLVFNIGVTAYFIIGAYFEERKLLRDFGEAYSVYKRNTPFLIPGLK